MLSPEKVTGDRLGIKPLLSLPRVVRLLLCVLILLMAVPVIGVARHVFADSNGPSLTVDASSGRHSISPDIYGMNLYGLDSGLAQELNTPVQRWGGNNTSRYNWNVDSSNAGNDYYYNGGGDGVYMGGSNPGQGNGVPGASVDRFVNSAQAQGSKSMVTVPMLPYVNKTSDPNCSYPQSLYPNQQSFITLSNGLVCGNGHDANGNNIPDTNIDLNNTPNSPDLQKAWIQHLVDTHGTTAQGGVNIYELDNEPSYWYGSHYDIHPNHTGYDELTTTSMVYAATIKTVDYTALTAGPSDFGWLGYTGGLAPAGDDSAAHGNLTLGQYYLQQMYAYQQKYDVRLLDYFDEHYYPSNNGSCLADCPAGDATTQQQRLDSTRSLWDPTYVDNSWIGAQYGAIQLIPRFHSWINQYDPGTKLAISEYNFGGLESINGALTQADVLGIFGREQVDLATIWGPPTPSQPGAYAFRMYRNYDGNGSQYGDTWINSASSDQSQLAIYGAQRSSDGALTLMVINKTGNDLTSALSLSNANVAANAQVFTYDSSNLNAIVQQPDQSVNSDGFTRTYPANSISLVVIPNNTTTAINAGGGAVGTFAADTNYRGGNASSSSTTPIVTQGVQHAAPSAIYQTNRTGKTFSYTLGGFKPNGSYIVRLQFAELDYSRKGQRQFEVTINGKAVAKNLDVLAEAGGKDKALVKDFTVAANKKGQITIAFSGGRAGNPFVSGLEVLTE